MPKVALLSHTEERLPLRLLAALGRADAEWFEVPVYEKPLPNDGFDAVIVLGGRMGAYDTDDFPWLLQEKDFLRRQVTDCVPVLGICLGSQLLADSLGGRVFLAPTPEVGVIPLELTDAGKVHRVLGAVGKKVFCFHQDTFELPPAANLLASSDRYPQAFEIGSALALQFHPEIDTTQAIDSASTEGAVQLLKAGLTLFDYAEQVRGAEVELEAAAAHIFDVWLAALK